MPDPSYPDAAPDRTAHATHGNKDREPTVQRVAVAGVSGYSGAELARILLGHPRFQSQPVTFLGRMEEGASVPLTELHPQLLGLRGAAESRVEPWTWRDLERERIDLLLLATPHEQSRAWVPPALSHGLRVIDLSGAWRLHSAGHRAVYRFDDTDAEAATRAQAEAVYGSPELHGPAIRRARLIANPGCYATSVTLALAPLLRRGWVDLDYGIIADAKSGVSGAGKAPTPTTHFMHAADNLSAYAVFGHRHTGELLEQLDLQADQLQFTPHLLPIPRGILSTIYLRLNETVAADQLQLLLGDFYRDSPTVRLRQSPMLPQIQYVVRTPFCDIGFQLEPHPAHGKAQRLVVVSCLDNLLKGAASQAVENLNLMAGWPQAEGLL